MKVTILQSSAVMKVAIIFYAVVTITGIQMCYAYYVYYPSLNRHCVPYLACGEGHAIEPCKSNFTRDVCVVCTAGYVQPDVISSTADPNATSCFKPTSACINKDLTYSRTPVKAFCKSLSGCKCNTAKCYFGDPCMCLHGPECKIGHFMNDIGGCIPCPNGTEKNTTGCGPCRAIRNTIPPPMLTTTAQLSTGQRTYTPTFKYNKSVISLNNTDIKAEKQNEGTDMYIFYVGIGLGILIITATLVIYLVVYRGSRKICFWSKCAIKGNRHTYSSESSTEMML